ALMSTIKKVRGALNPTLQVEGLVLTMFDARNRLSHEIAHEVQVHFPDLIFQSVIPRNVRLSESPSHGLSVIEYDGKSAGAEAYQALTGEILQRDHILYGSAANKPQNGKKERRSWNLRALFNRETERAKKGRREEG
ncbi:MAG: ParA family protein, partial [Stellaceae bacterium]